MGNSRQRRIARRALVRDWPVGTIVRVVGGSVSYTVDHRCATYCGHLTLVGRNGPFPVHPNQLIRVAHG